MNILKVKPVLCFLFLFLLFNQNSFCQEEIKIKFIGNCGLHLSDGQLDLFVDFPYKSGAYGYMEYKDTELQNIPNNSIFFYTHKHADHYSRKIVNNVLKEKKGIKFSQWQTKKLVEYFDKILDIDLQVFKTKHRFSLNHKSYLLTWHGKKIYLSGDTEHAETISKIKDLDWAFVPYWILLDANEKDIKIDAKMIGIYHIATVQIPSIKENSNDIQHIKPMINQGEVIVIK